MAAEALEEMRRTSDELGDVDCGNAPERRRAQVAGDMRHHARPPALFRELSREQPNDAGWKFFIRNTDERWKVPAFGERGAEAFKQFRDQGLAGRIELVEDMHGRPSLEKGAQRNHRVIHAAGRIEPRGDAKTDVPAHDGDIGGRSHAVDESSQRPIRQESNGSKAFLNDGAVAAAEFDEIRNGADGGEDPVFLLFRSRPPLQRRDEEGNKSGGAGRGGKRRGRAIGMENGNGIRKVSPYFMVIDHDDIHPRIAGTADGIARRHAGIGGEEKRRAARGELLDMIRFEAVAIARAVREAHQGVAAAATEKPHELRNGCYAVAVVIAENPHTLSVIHRTANPFDGPADIPEGGRGEEFSNTKTAREGDLSCNHFCITYTLRNYPSFSRQRKHDTYPNT